MQIDYIPSPTFEKIHNDLNKYLFVMGPVNSGKSTGCIFQPFIRALDQYTDEDGVRRWRHVVIRKTSPSLELNTIPSWQQWFKNALKFKWSKPITATIKLPLNDGTKLELKVDFIGIEHEKDLSKLKSLECSSIHMNEADELTRAIYELAKTRIDRWPAKKDGGVKNAFIICDYNGVSTDHWLYQMSTENLKGHSFYRQPPAVLIDHVDEKGKTHYKVNPDAENLDYVGDFYENQLESSDDFIRVNLMNEYGEVRKGKPVYKDYSDSQHLVDLTGTDEVYAVSTNTKVVIGMDLGLTPAAAFTQRLWDGTVVVFEEIVTDDTSIEEFVQNYLFPTIAKYRCGGNYVVVPDPAGNSRSSHDKKTAVELLKELGVVVQQAKAQDPVRRINSVMNYLRKPNKFRLMSNCSYLRRGFLSEYKYSSSNLIDGTAKTPKAEKNIYSHVHDALQYAMLEYDPGYSKHKTYIKFPKRRYTVASPIGGY